MFFHKSFWQVLSQHHKFHDILLHIWFADIWFLLKKKNNEKLSYVYILFYEI